MKLEEELRQNSLKHKFKIIELSLILFEDNGIYKSPFLRDKYSITLDSGVCKARRVISELALGGDDELLEEVYNECWSMLQGSTYADKLERMGI